MLERIEEFATLAPGWDSYDGEAISRETIEAAKKVVPLLVSISQEYWSVFPCGDGSIQFESLTTTLTVWSEKTDPKLCNLLRNQNGIVTHHEA
jgi:hypothetical protein